MRHQHTFSRKLVTASLTVGLILGSFPQGAYPQVLDDNNPNMSLKTQVDVPNGDTNRITLDYARENIRNVLRELSWVSGFNLVMDESVEGDISVSLNNVTINQALQSVARLGNIEIIPQSGNIYLAIASKEAQSKGLSRQLSKVIRLDYTSARRVAGILNSSVFAQQGAGGAGGALAAVTGGGGAGGQNLQKARPDNRSNSIVVVGTAQDIKVAEEVIQKLDKPRHRKTFYLSHANALDVATLIAGGVFNDGNAILDVGEDEGGGGGGGGGGGAGGAQGGQEEAQASKFFVESETIAEGAGVNNLSGSTGGDTGGSASGSLSQSITLRGTVKTTETAKVLPEGPIVIPDTRTNSVTIMGTAEQIALVEQMIPTLDARLPQVSIEVSLIEVSEAGRNSLSNQVGIADGKLQLGFNNQALPTIDPPPNLGNVGLIGLPTVNGQNQALAGVGFSTSPLTTRGNFLVQLEALIRNNQAKILANPTVVAMHDTESVISLVQEVIRRTTVTIEGTTGTVTNEIELGDAGIVLDILPKVGEDGTINMRIRPSVTSVLQTTQDGGGNTVTLLSKRDLLTQNVRIRDNETLVLGGIINESENRTHQKIPLLGELPIIGALMRSSVRNTNRTELVILMTPHILNTTTTTPVSYTEAIVPGGNY